MIREMIRFRDYIQSYEIKIQTDRTSWIIIVIKWVILQSLGSRFIRS